MKMTIKALKKQLKEQKILTKQRIQALIEDRTIREKEHSTRINQLKEEMIEIKNKYNETTNTYLTLKHNTSQNQKKLLQKLVNEEKKVENLSTKVSFIENEAKKNQSIK